MIIEHFDKFIRLTPDNGKYLHNGDTYTLLAYLPLNASTEDWDEVTDIPQPEADDELTDAEALAIIKGELI